MEPRVQALGRDEHLRRHSHERIGHSHETADDRHCLPYVGGYGYGYGHGGVCIIGIILIVLVVMLLVGRL
jgi:hypothetical protein